MRRLTVPEHYSGYHEVITIFAERLAFSVSQLSTTPFLGSVLSMYTSRMTLLQVVWHIMPTRSLLYAECTMATRNVVLTDHLEKVVNDLVLSGRYQNASEVLREGLRLLEKREAEEAAKLEALRHATSLGLMDLETGRFVEISGDELGGLLDDIGNQVSGSVGDEH